FGRVAGHENGGLLALHRHDRGGEPDLDRRERGGGPGGRVGSARGAMRQLGCAAAPRLMGGAQARGGGRYPVFLLLFTGETGLDRTPRCSGTRYSSSSRNGSASYAISPRPMASIAATMRPSRPSTRSASATRRPLGVAVAEARRSACAIAHS